MGYLVLVVVLVFILTFSCYVMLLVRVREQDGTETGCWVVCCVVLWEETQGGRTHTPLMCAQVKQEKERAEEDERKTRKR